MKTIKVIARKQLPVKPPIIGTVVILLVLDRFNAPQAVWGAAFVLILIYWITVIYLLQHQEDVKLKAPELKVKGDEGDEE